MPSVNTRLRAATTTAARYMWWAATVLSDCVWRCVCVHLCKSLHANLFPMNKIIYFHRNACGIAKIRGVSGSLVHNGYKT